ncbi:DUF4389 domain-containing protein [Pseudonocardia oceani]|uniref:DUF4389 domain-containing protein n=4 Tax=Pseudonocardia oceani TaxID=2792013 RepID=A0ABS6UHR0_9PSEU|nr:DUF4389 domain-containing protein [Pseudonocardia oceani]MBW0131760.1 DUF4389 domain-containing protein [Pseudonocardia oceani]
MAATGPSYPVRVDAAAQPSASRGLWLVKWVLLVPHYVVLAFLWIAFVVVGLIAFVAILATGRYPRPLFEFAVGVLRWTWRVHYYGYGALATDRYPPFTLAEVPDYPAHLDVPYPERLSRGLVLVKWWLLALPHYLVVAIFVGGGIWLGTTGPDRDGVWDTSWGAGGLVGLLVLIAGVVLLFTGRYPQGLYDAVLGMDRWALRVAAYAALLTDEYPPFRLDVGGVDPGSAPPASGGPAAAPSPPTPSPATPSVALHPAATGAVPPPRPAPWSGGRVVSLVVGSVLLFGAAGSLVSAGSLLWLDQTRRDGDYLMTPAAGIGTNGHAVVSESFRLEGEGLDWAVDEVVGDARFEVAPVPADEELFVGVARSADVDAYLRGVGHAELRDLQVAYDSGWRDRFVTTERTGGAPLQPPAEAGIWSASTSGAGVQELTWRPADGDWTVVVMRADGTAGVAADVRAGVTAPGLGWLVAALFTTGVVLLALGGLLVGLAVPQLEDRQPVTPRPGTRPEDVGAEPHAVR